MPETRGCEGGEGGCQDEGCEPDAFAFSKLAVGREVRTGDENLAVRYSNGSVSALALGTGSQLELASKLSHRIPLRRAFVTRGSDLTQ